jgi:hypothetical protein
MYVYKCLYRSKSAKLAFAFDLMDGAHSASLRRRGLWRLFRSLLCALLTLTADLHGQSASGSGAADVATGLAEPAALWLADSVLLYANQSTSPVALAEELNGSVFATTPTATSSSASFDHLAGWYSQCGFQLAPWLELLDLNKWNYLLIMPHADDDAIM